MIFLVDSRSFHSEVIRAADCLAAAGAAVHRRHSVRGASSFIFPSVTIPAIAEILPAPSSLPRHHDGPGIFIWVKGETPMSVISRFRRGRHDEA